MHSTATFFGSAAFVLGFHVPDSNEANCLDFRNCAVLNVVKGESYNLQLQIFMVISL